MITLAQLRGARGLLHWSQKYLAEKCGLSERAINRIECGDTDPKVSTLRTIQVVLEEAGIEFINESDGSEGVKLKGRRFEI